MRFASAVCLLLVAVVGFPVVRASADVESRIISAIGWINGQKVSNVEYVGFARGNDPDTNRTVFVEDQALVALALSDYHSTHNDDRYDNLLNVAARFINSARTPRGDFYEYYDLRTGRWLHAGDFYSWNAYAIAGLAAAAYKISSKDYSQRTFWFPIEAKLKQSVTIFLGNQRDDGAWAFHGTSTTAREALTRENAVFLVGLLYLGLFESQWGSPEQARLYGQLAEKTATWIFSVQENNTALATFGGFPHSDTNSTQLSEENGEVLWGVDTYYSTIGVLLPQPSPSIWDARRAMADWVSGFAEKMRDSYGGPYNGRTSTSLNEYPKTTRGAAWMLQALVDIWINLGGPRYYDNSQKSYDWIVGGNELGAELQQASSISGVQGGFYESISAGTVDRTSRTDVTASALYAFVRSAFVQVPEFPRIGAILVFFAAVFGVLVLTRRKIRNGYERASSCVWQLSSPLEQLQV